LSQGREGAALRFDAVSQETCRDFIFSVPSAWADQGSQLRAAQTGVFMRRVFLFIAAIVSLGTSGAQADTSNPDSTKVFLLPDTIVVTANRFGLEPGKCIWPSAVVRPQTLAQSVSLSDALSSGTGVDLRDYSGVGSVATLSNWGTFNRHMLLLYDGRVVRDYSLGGFNLSEYSPAEFDRVELVKGPQSAFYGSDALGGVVNLVPKSTLFDRVGFSSQIGSLDYRRHRLEASQKLSQIGIGGWGEMMNADNARPNSGVDQESFGVRADLLSRDARRHVHLSARSFSDSIGSPGPVPPPGEFPALGNDRATSLYDHQKDKNASFDTHYDWRPIPSVDIRFDAFSDRKTLTYVSKFEEFWNDPVDTARTVTTYRKRSSGLTGRVQKNVHSTSYSAGIDWLYGSLDYRNEQSGPFAVSPDRWNGHQRQLDIWSAFSTGITGKLRPDLSGRLGLVKGRTAQPSYNLGAIYDLSSNWQIKAGLGHAYRLPSLADQFAQDTYTRGNPDLAAEVASTGVGSVAFQSTSHHLSARLSVFRQRVKDLIQYAYDPAIFQYVPRNVNRFHSDGIDISVRSLSGRKLTVDLAAVYQKAEQTIDSSGTYVNAFYVPDLTWSLAADYRASGLVSAGGRLRFVSDRWIQMYNGDEKTIEKVYEIGAHVDVHLSRSLTIGLIGEDLTDQKRPSQFGYSVTDRDYPGPGRRFFVRLTASAGGDRSGY
jgi:vitamin B12 transporter